jgi:hypothetical protein
MKSINYFLMNILARIIASITLLSGNILKAFLPETIVADFDITSFRLSVKKVPSQLPAVGRMYQKYAVRHPCHKTVTLFNANKSLSQKV